MNKILTSSLIALSVLSAKNLQAGYKDIKVGNSYYYGSVKYVNRFIRHSTYGFLKINTSVPGTQFPTSYAEVFHSPVASFSFGKKVDSGLRFDVEYAKSSAKKIIKPNSISKEAVNTISFNFYHDFSNRTKFTPYIGVGAGLSLVHVVHEKDFPMGPGLIDAALNSSTMSYNISTGFSVSLTKVLELDFGYRYVSYGRNVATAMGDDTAIQRWAGNDFYAGVRFKF